MLTKREQSQPRSRISAGFELYRFVAGRTYELFGLSAVGDFILWIPICLLAGGFLKLIGYRDESSSIGIPIGIYVAGMIISAVFLLYLEMNSWEKKDPAQKEHFQSLTRDARGIGLGSVGAGVIGGVAGTVSGMIVSLFAITVIVVSVVAAIVSVFAIPLLLSVLLLLT